MDEEKKRLEKFLQERGQRLPMKETFDELRRTKKYVLAIDFKVKMAYVAFALN